MPILVPEGQRNSLPCRHAAGHVHAHVLAAFFFVNGLGGVKKLFGFRRVFRAGAEHPGAPFACPVPVRKAGAGEGLLQFFFLGGGGGAVILQQCGINTGDDGHIFRPLHAAF